MPTLNPAVAQWIRQMADSDQVVAYYAYQCLQEEVFLVSRPGQDAAQAALATALGEALVAQAKPGQGARARGAASFRGNIFLTAAATETIEALHPARVRNGLARLLGYLPGEAGIPYLAKALNDLEVRETARQALECNPSERATEALISALHAVGPTFCAGVVNSLAKRGGPKVITALKEAARDPQEEVRLAALLALADFPDASSDAILERAAQSASADERRTAHRARARLAETLRAGGKKTEAERIYRAILSSDAPGPQKKAARLALGLA